MAELRWRRRLRLPRRRRRDAPPPILRVDTTHLRVSVHFRLGTWRFGGNRASASRAALGFRAAHAAVLAGAGLHRAATAVHPTDLRYGARTGLPASQTAHRSSSVLAPAISPSSATQVTFRAAVAAHRIVPRTAAVAAVTASPMRGSSRALRERGAWRRAPLPSVARARTSAMLRADTASQARGERRIDPLARASAVAVPATLRPGEVGLPRHFANAAPMTSGTAHRDRARRPTASEAPSPRARSHVRSIHAVDLVWRRSVTDAMSGNVGAAAHRSLPLSTEAVKAASAQARMAPMEVAAPRNAAAAARPALDAAAIDRLTDDVIRRVERRIRIERERRGF
jgi:hypothetical protein